MKTILIADDEPLIRKLLADELRHEGFEVIDTGDVHTARDVLDARDIDVVLSDVSMPRGSGMELLHWSKGRSTGRPVVMMSGLHDIEADTIFHMGADGWLVKPFAMEDVLTTLHRLLEPSPRRWEATSGGDASVRYGLIYGDVDDAERLGRLAIGRGGFFLATDEELPRVGSVVGFVFSFREGALPRLAGEGVVRWIRHGATSELRAGIGVEFHSLDAESLAGLANDSVLMHRAAYIPIGVKRSFNREV